jgi:hypothetical protein
MLPRVSQRPDNQTRPKQQRYQARLKAKVGLEALAGSKTVAESARGYHIEAADHFPGASWCALLVAELFLAESGGLDYILGGH